MGLKNHKKGLTAKLKTVTVLFLGMFIGLWSGGAIAQPIRFSDMPSGVWYERSVNNLVEKGIIKGYDDNTFRADNYVNRAEMAVISDRLLTWLSENNFQQEGNIQQGEVSDKMFFYVKRVPNPECKPVFIDQGEQVCAEMKLVVNVLSGKEFVVPVEFENADASVILKAEGIPETTYFHDLGNGKGEFRGIQETKFRDHSFYSIFATDSDGRQRKQTIELRVSVDDTYDVDKDGTPDFQDDCVYNFGRKETKGCPDKIINEWGIIEELVNIEVKFEKIDFASSVILTAKDLPEGAIFTDKGNGQGIFQWTPEFNQHGRYEIYITAADSDGNTEIQMIDLDIDCDGVKCSED